MRFMMLMIPKGYESAPVGEMPPADGVAKMMKYNEEILKAGILVSCEGLHPPAAGARVTFETGKPKVADGPFAEVKEVLGGFWIINVKSKAEAIEWASRCPAGKNEIIEVRQVQEMEDFPEDVQKAAAGFDAMQNPKPVHQRNLFVNLPVKNLDKSKAFFAALGMTFNPQFTDEKAACMIMGDNIFAMLLMEKFFKTFTTKAIADTKTSIETLTAITMPTREEVDRIVHAALKAGGKTYSEPKDHGFMYQWGFEDLDGHIWEPFWMDPNFLQK